MDVGARVGGRSTLLGGIQGMTTYREWFSVSTSPFRVELTVIF